METEKTIKEKCLSWAKDIFGESFKFRKYQLETAVSIIKGVISEESVKCQTIEAPTGSGKSNIAVVCCGVLWKYFKKKSYILASDLSLIDQYARDFKKWHLDWGVIKGSENYMCFMNNMPFNFGECKMKKVSYSVLMNYDLAKNAGYECSSSCEYIQARKAAMQAPVTLMTYSLWLLQRNQVAEMYESIGQDPPFEERDFVVCDECHKLGDIVQDQFSPVIDSRNDDKISELLAFGSSNGANVKHTLSAFKSKALDIYKAKSSDDLYKALVEYQKCLSGLSHINSVAHKICEKDAAKFKDKDFRKVLFCGEFESSAFDSLTDYIKLIDFVGKECMVKNCDSPDRIKLNCIYEDFLVKKYFHDRCKNELLMSATIGNSEIYAHSIGVKRIKDWKGPLFRFEEIPSTFDFSKSPIYFIPGHKMSFKEKEASLPYVSSLIYKICSKYAGTKGIIHTGTFEFSKYLYANAPADIKRRFLMYADSKIKGDMILEYKDSDDAILIGPSLTTGLSLDDDLCRFLIFMKVPYLSLADVLIKAKMENSKLWYTNQTIINLQQGFGRGIRNPKDWCVSFVVDGCFDDLVKHNGYLMSKSLLDRIVWLK